MKHHYYNINEYVGGHTEYVTPCPYGLIDHRTGSPLMVGSRACGRCDHHHHADTHKQMVYCNYQKKDTGNRDCTKKPLFKDL